MHKAKKILFITSSLELGGAERQLLMLCQELRAHVDLEIISLAVRGPLLSKYLEAFPNIKFVDSQKYSFFRAVTLLRKEIISVKPDAVVTWLYLADILGGIAVKSCSKLPVFWSARNSKIPNFRYYKRFALGLLSRFIPTYVVANGISALKFHKSIGYPQRKLLRIPNFLSSWTYGAKSESKLLQSQDGVEYLKLGIASRQVSGKGILETIENIANLPPDFPRIELDLIGQESKESKKWSQIGLYANYHSRPRISDEDIASWFTKLDVYVMPSTSWESQPNSLIEAVAIGCPVICSDLIELEIFFPQQLRFNPRDSRSFNQALQNLISMDASEIELLTNSARSELLKNFQKGKIIQAWLELFDTSWNKI